MLPEETENNNHNNPKWTLNAMEKYMRDQSESSIALGLVAQPPPMTNTNNKRRPVPVQSHPVHHLIPTLQNDGDILESGGEESSPSWASSSTGNTPSYGSSGMAFEFNSKTDDPFDKTTPVITTTSCTPKSTPENTAKKIMPLSLSTDLLSALDSDLELPSKPRKSRKDSQSSVKSEDSRGTPTKTSKLRKLLRRTRSAGCSKDVPGNSHFTKEKAVSELLNNDFIYSLAFCNLNASKNV